MTLLSPIERQSRVIFLCVLLLSLLGTFLINPVSPFGGKRTCGFLLLTGLPCPTCGMTRAVSCISHGRVSDSVRFHPLGVFVYGAALVAAGILVIELSQGRRIFFLVPQWRWWVIGSIAGVVVAVWIARIWLILNTTPQATHNSLIYKMLIALR